MSKGFEGRHPPGKKTRNVFKKGAAMSGYGRVMYFDHLGFFFVPSDTQGNNERVFAVLSSLRDLEVNHVRIDFTSWREG